MTTRATFGDFADLTTRHLSQLPTGATRTRRAGPPVRHVEAVIRDLHGVLAAMARLCEDARATLAAAPRYQRTRAAQWDRAASRTRDALSDAIAFLREGTTITADWGEGPEPGDLAAAGTSITLARDLLHTHLAPADARAVRSEWAPVILSVPVACAVLHELSGWAYRIAEHGSYAALAGRHGSEQFRLSLTCASQRLYTLQWAVGTAGDNQPLSASDLDLLHSIPLNMLPARQLPTGSEPIADLCQGIIDTAERVRHAARQAAADATWSPAMTRDALSHTAACCTVASWNSVIILDALAARAKRSDPRLSAQLVSAAEAADQARATWLRTAGTWDDIGTDTIGTISLEASEVGDLALWTGRLAYTDPAWTPRLGPSRARRSPEAVAPSPDDVPRVISAVQHVCHTLAQVA
ncbi:MAG TPA: hypothetical protein VF832_11560, partial [Longimicrobiales bacterium]